MKPKSYPLDEYLEVKAVTFPKRLPVAYAVCAKKCGNRAFIVDGSTQVCEYCGHLMFRAEVTSYSRMSIRRAKRDARRVRKKNA